MKGVRISFGAERSEAVGRDGELAISLGAPLVAGTRRLSLHFPDGEVREEAGGVIYDGDELVAGFLRGRRGKALEASTGELYDRMFSVLSGRSPYRIWHFVPRINAWDSDLENYRLFCRGRADAFRRVLGETFQGALPAASAVGSIEEEPVMLFVGGRDAPRHAENPEQVPAYQYPAVYGPRAPSFARASRVALAGGTVVFVSGTASIKASETIHPGNCEKQVATTLHNLSLIGEASGLGGDLGRAAGAGRCFVTYLRRVEDFPLVASLLRKQLICPGDQTVYLQADICRSDLMVEIEATVVLPASAAPPPP